MAEAQSRNAVLVARTAVALIIGLTALGLVWYGFSAEVQQRLWRDIFDRPGGPMAFRFLLQPVMATILAVRDGIRDAHLGRSPYFRTILSDAEESGPRLREGLIATGRVILLGLVMDVIYQVRVSDTFYPGEAAVVALLLAFLPYLLVRGLAACIARRWSQRPSGAAD
jgi:hypothetical protein